MNLKMHSDDRQGLCAFCFLIQSGWCYSCISRHLFLSFLQGWNFNLESMIFKACQIITKPSTNYVIFLGPVADKFNICLKFMVQDASIVVSYNAWPINEISKLLKYLLLFNQVASYYVWWKIVNEIYYYFYYVKL